VTARLTASAVTGLPELRPGDDLPALIVAAMQAENPPLRLRDGQVAVIAHKAVSKVEGALVALSGVEAGPRAHALAADAPAQGPNRAKDPRVVQVVLEESAEILRTGHGVLICRTHHGFVCANAGVDTSNSPDPDTVVVLPRDPDLSARLVRAGLRRLTGATVAVLITDSFGRAWRHGQCDVAVGCAGMGPLEDWRGRSDATGRRLQATWLAVADAAAATADLAREKDSREPVVIVEGLERYVTEEDGPGAAALVRPLEEDLFR
jgi:coenzyme F420-0:L-glutamate ligase/coenzyme F420-1:gamma-L-glutamate ligase